MGLSPYMKFVAPAILALVAAVVHGLITGEWDKQELEIMSVAFVTTTVAFVATNAEDGIRRFTKALAPAFLTLVGLGAHYAFTGEWNQTETSVAVVGLLSSFVTFLVPNTPVAPGEQRDPVTPEGSDAAAADEATPREGRRWSRDDGVTRTGYEGDPVNVPPGVKGTP